MELAESLRLTGIITQIIASNAPVVDYTVEEIEQARKGYTEEKLRELQNDGYYNGDFELFYVLKRFCDDIDLWKNADEVYIKKLFANAKRLGKDYFYADEYLKNIKIPDVKKDNTLLLNVSYDKGELLQYDMPELDSDIVVPKLAFFDEKVFFPSVYEGNMPWVSVCPSEINSMGLDIDKANGRCLVLGLGLGYYPYMISLSDKVKSITVVEINEKIIDLFKTYILPQFEHKDKIKIVHADALEYMKQVERDEYDFCYADIWEGQEDGAIAYSQIKPHEKRLPYTRFAYWIEKEIRWYLLNMSENEVE